MLKSFVRLQNFISSRKVAHEERGATAFEYFLMVGLIAAAIIGAVMFIDDPAKKPVATTTIAP